MPDPNPGVDNGMPARPPISNYMSELPNSQGRTLTDESYGMHGILSGPEPCQAPPEHVLLLIARIRNDPFR
jgi:hypothetical protein